MNFFEPYCGLAAVTQSLFYGGLTPPCSRHGAKTGYAGAILREMGLEGVRARGGREITNVLLCDVDRSLVNAMRDLFHRPTQLAREVAVLSERGGDARECWDLAKLEKDGSTAAWWLWCCGAFRGVGQWRGGHVNRPNIDGFSPGRQELARRIAARPVLRHVSVDCSDALDMFAVPTRVEVPTYVYIDAPYQNTADYGEPPPSEDDLCYLAGSWRAAGAVVCVSEAKPFKWPGFRTVDITNQRIGQSRKDSISKTEWLTVSR